MLIIIENGVVYLQSSIKLNCVQLQYKICPFDYSSMRPSVDAVKYGLWCLMMSEANIVEVIDFAAPLLVFANQNTPSSGRTELLFLMQLLIT